MAVCDDSIESYLMEIGCLQLQHLMDAFSVDLVRCITNFCGRAISASKASADELLAVSVQKIKGRQVGTRRDLDQLCKPIPDLGGGQGAEEGKVEESVNGCVVGSQTILVVAIVDSHFYRHRCVNQTNDSGWDSDEVGVPAIRRTSEAATMIG